ncbi:guanylate kinase [Leptolyngbya sp. Heron Island J]|uniref:guanylate kinase n=1 Tax=Leptolyngbya sp. Heron Island J TaxID=1385935 RepID=UPI0003B9E443|nr:guanylate kinase [Leptolyngbya sp. Heron Island J]ESA38320.1 guanylate kinase [Leptolyngbya sp. Heron Island J]
MPSISLPVSSQTVATSSASGQLIVFTGPSGVGKGTLLRQLLKRHPDIQLSISATTRQPRPGEEHGKHYYFVSRAEFDVMVAQEQLLEWAEFAGNYYGTPRQPLEAMIDRGHVVILEIELEGARQVRQTLPKAPQIFVLPPSLQELEARIRQRGQDSDAAIAKRLTRAEVEIAAASEFDIQIINDDLERALTDLEKAVFSQLTPTTREEHPPSPQEIQQPT